ncbi:retrovirus-related pol polyprotein from transposon TNT 1-94 [Tanacetum coccineum]
MAQQSHKSKCQHSGVAAAVFAPPLQLSPISYPGAGVVRQALFRGGISASGTSVLGEVVGLVVSGDGRGNGEDATGSGGVGAAAYSAMRASMDADIGGLDSFVSNASVSPAKGTGSTIGIAEESAGAGCSSSSFVILLVLERLLIIIIIISVITTWEGYHLHPPLSQGNQHAPCSTRPPPDASSDQKQGVLRSRPHSQGTGGSTGSAQGSPSYPSTMTRGVDLLSGSCGSNLYTISMADMMKSSLICLLSKASKTKSCLWPRRLSHLNFGTINKLAKQGLVKGLPKLKYTKDHLCLACEMGKSKKESHPHKPKPSTNEKLQMLHMDLCEDADEAPEIIIKILIQAQVSLNATIRYLRIDNGTKFLNQTLRNYTEDVGITHTTSTARTP